MLSGEVTAVYRAVPRRARGREAHGGVRARAVTGRTVVAVVDCTSFYCACEAAFDPRLVGRPVVVLSNNDGCIVARSPEAKRLGLPMGAPLFKVRRMVETHKVAVYSSNYALYADMSRRVMQVLQRFSADVEAYSIDEAFLLLPMDTPPNLMVLGHAIRKAVRREVGVDTHVGIGPTKTLAKVGDEISRGEGGVAVVTAGDPRIASVAVEDVWGIGRRYAPRLRDHGIETAADLAAVPAAWARRAMTVVGERLVRELRGEACLPLELLPPLRKSVARTRSFGHVVTDAHELRRAVATYAARAAEKIRGDGLVAGSLSVFITTKEFGGGETHHGALTVPLVPPTADTRVLVRLAADIARQMQRPGVGYRKAGVILGGLVPAAPAQAHLFSRPDPMAGPLMRAMDGLNARYGPGTVHVALASRGLGGRHEAWQIKSERRSPRYTTVWAEVPRVRA